MKLAPSIAILWILLLPESSPAMEYVEVCNDKGACFKLGRLIMGTDHLIQENWQAEGQPQISKSQAFEVLDEAARAGINLFDTSPIYVGGVESVLEEWLVSRRQEITQAGFYPSPDLNPDRKIHTLTKGGFPFDLFYSQRLEAGTHSPELMDLLRKDGILDPQSPLSATGSALRNVPPGTYASRLFGDKKQIIKRVSEELRHSPLDDPDGQITIYLMHRDDRDFLRFDPVKRNQTSVRTIMEALSAPEFAKEFDMIGWSNWTTERVNESLAMASADPLLRKPSFNSPYFSLFEMSDRTIHAGGVQVTHTEMMNPEFQKGILLNPYSPLGGFSIFDKPEPAWENAKKSALKKFEQGDAYWQNVYPAIFTPENEQRYQRVVSFTAQFNRAHRTSYTVDQMINAYALAHPRTDFLTVGPVSVEQVRRTGGALKLSKLLTPSDLEYLHSGRRPSVSNCADGYSALARASRRAGKL